MLVLAALALLAAGCGKGNGVNEITVGAARTYRLADFQPAQPVKPDAPTQVAFTIDQPSGAPLTKYRKGAGPHTGVHVIAVSDDLTTIIHDHPPIGADGRVATPMTFRAPGRYRVLVDAYPQNTQQPNFQLFHDVTVSGAAKPQPLPPFRRDIDLNGVHVVLHGGPVIRAIQPTFLRVNVTDASGRPATFTPWFGALAHAIFFRAGTLSYFHTHVCGASTPACAGAFGGARISGTSSKPGVLRVGVLLPQPGTWRMFLQFRIDRVTYTAPFTLTVR